MDLPKRYDHTSVEPRLEAEWQESGVYRYSSAPDDGRPVYSVDTPPPTVSGRLHLGHVYSYSHADFMVRFWRMNDHNVFYPMGYDDNGLPTERLVERARGITAPQVGRSAFIRACLEVSEEAEKEYQALWQRMGLSVDWRYTYRTIDEHSRLTSQRSFLDLYQNGLAYRDRAPVIWCPECRTAIAQAEVNELERESEFVTLSLQRDDATILPIATTRPELLPACVAVFVHPDDGRFRDLVGRRVKVPIYGQEVPVLADPGADPEKGTGAVMCCTFGDAADVGWWRTYQLPLVVAIGQDGRLTEVAGEYAGLSVPEARRRIVATLSDRGLLLARRTVAQTVRVHERCDTPVEYLVTPQWFIRILDFKETWLAAADQIAWHPPFMKSRYREWVEDLKWDWLISRQRYFGIPFPVWYCDTCGAVSIASEAELPVDPSESQPSGPCACGGSAFTPDRDVMDTWATSSLTPQIVGRWLRDDGLYSRVFPMSLRAQAHEIIRTWAFYTIVKSHHHFGVVPWRAIAPSGWGLAPEGAGKISKSRGGGGLPSPEEMIAKYGADAIRYWAASTGFGRDTIISEEKMQAGAKLVTKLWNVARFSQRFLGDFSGLPLPSTSGEHPRAERPNLFPADRWILSRTQHTIRRSTQLFRVYDYAGAKGEVETFFWRDLADNYLELVKDRLYGEDEPAREAARYGLYHAFLATIKLFAPFLPHVTDEIYRALIRVPGSLHRGSWPEVDEDLESEESAAMGEVLLEVVSAVRRYKSEHNMSVGAKLERLQLAPREPAVAAMLREAATDVQGVTGAARLDVADVLDPTLEVVATDGAVGVAVMR